MLEGGDYVLEGRGQIYSVSGEKQDLISKYSLINSIIMYLVLIFLTDSPNIKKSIILEMIDFF